MIVGTDKSAECSAAAEEAPGVGVASDEARRPLAASVILTGRAKKTERFLRRGRRSRPPSERAAVKLSEADTVACGMN